MIFAIHSFFLFFCFFKKNLELFRVFSSVAISGDFSPNPRFWATLWRWKIWAGDVSPIAEFPRFWASKLAILANSNKTWRFWRNIEGIGKNQSYFTDRSAKLQRNLTNFFHLAQLQNKKKLYQNQKIWSTKYVKHFENVFLN